MKKHYTIESGKVVEISAMSLGLTKVYVDASNKTEATEKLLAMAEHSLTHVPRLSFKNGAWQMIYSAGTHYTSETGTIARGGLGLCLAGFKTEREAQLDKTFEYYSSPDYLQASIC